MGLSNVYGVPGLGKRDSATLIDGKAIAAELRAEVAAGDRELVAERGSAPALATILIG